MLITSMADGLVGLEAVGSEEDLAAVRAGADGRPGDGTAAGIDDQPAFVAAGQPPQRQSPRGRRRRRRQRGTGLCGVDERRELVVAGDAGLRGGIRPVDDSGAAVVDDVGEGAERGAGGELGVAVLGGGGSDDGGGWVRARPPGGGVVDVGLLDVLAGEEVLEKLPGGRFVGRRRRRYRLLFPPPLGIGVVVVVAVALVGGCCGGPGY